MFGSPRFANTASKLSAHSLNCAMVRSCIVPKWSIPAVRRVCCCQNLAMARASFSRLVFGGPCVGVCCRSRRISRCRWTLSRLEEYRLVAGVACDVVVLMLLPGSCLPNNRSNGSVNMMERIIIATAAEVAASLNRGAGCIAIKGERKDKSAPINHREGVVFRVGEEENGLALK